MDGGPARNQYSALDLAGADIDTMIESCEVISLKQENAHLKAQLEIICKERDDYRHSLRESQKLQDHLMIMLNRSALQAFTPNITT